MSPLILKEGFLNGEPDKLIWENKKTQTGNRDHKEPPAGGSCLSQLRLSDKSLAACVRAPQFSP